VRIPSGLGKKKTLKEEKRSHTWAKPGIQLVKDLLREKNVFGGNSEVCCRGDNPKSTTHGVREERKGQNTTKKKKGETIRRDAFL